MLFGSYARDEKNILWYNLYRSKYFINYKLKGLSMIHSGTKKQGFRGNFREKAISLLIVFLIGFGLYQVLTPAMKISNGSAFRYSLNSFVRLFQNYVWGSSNGIKPNGTEPVIGLNGTKPIIGISEGAKTKVLVVSYLPSLNNSKTKRLLDAFVENVKDRNEMEYLDLLQNVPDFVTPEILNAYFTRNYMGKKLSGVQQKVIAKFDRMTNQFKSADIVVIAFPMYNFSMPGLVKAYFDSVIMKGETFDIGQKGFAGLMEGKKALILFSSGGVYDEKNSAYDHLTDLTKLEFGFMGFSDVRVVSVQGMNMDSIDNEKIIMDAQEQIKKITQDWQL